MNGGPKRSIWTQISHVWMVRLEHVWAALDLWSLPLSSINMLRSACRGLILINHVKV